MSEKPIDRDHDSEDLGSIEGLRALAKRLEDVEDFITMPNDEDTYLFTSFDEEFEDYQVMEANTEIYRAIAHHVNPDMGFDASSEGVLVTTTNAEDIDQVSAVVAELSATDSLYYVCYVSVPTEDSPLEQANYRDVIKAAYDVEAELIDTDEGPALRLFGLKRDVFSCFYSYLHLLNRPIANA